MKLHVSAFDNCSTQHFFALHCQVRRAAHKLRCAMIKKSFASRFLCEHFLLSSYLIENIEIVGVVIVGEVEYAITRVRSYPLEASIAIRHAARLHFILTKFRRHLGCGKEEEKARMKNEHKNLLNGGW